VQSPVEQPIQPSPDAASRSRVIRAACAIVGTVALVIGVVGLVVPVLPTTPFLLLAAACYARASERMYTWLIGQRALGPIVSEWRESRSLPPGVKPRALIVILITFAASILLVEELLVRAVLAVTGTVLTVFLARLPTRA
jgi:uncharacterized membrane protein YbaN (DUF454 family)